MRIVRARVVVPVLLGTLLATLLVGSSPAAGVNAVHPVAAAESASQAPTSPAARDRFYVKDKHRYHSPWYAGRHRKMIPYGCTRAPY